MGRRAQRQHWDWGPKSRCARGWGGEQPPAPRHRAVPRCPRQLGQAGLVWPDGFCLQSSGRNTDSNRLGTGKTSGLSMNQRGRNENPLLPNFPRLALLADEPLPCQMQEKNVPPPHDCILKKAFTRQKCFTRKICQVDSKET